MPLPSRSPSWSPSPWPPWSSKLYGALITGLSVLHYGVFSRFSGSDESGLAWFRRRLHPVLPAAPGPGQRIWIHAVSAGEAKVAESLRHSLRARWPDVAVVLSSTTYAGHARVSAVAGSGASFVMPLDTLAAQRRIFSVLQPDLLVLVESEYWPAQFAAAAEAGVPVVVVNATLSERSFRGHRRFPALSRATVLRAERIFAQDEAIAARYAAIGVPASRLDISGNLKLAPPPGRDLPGRQGGQLDGVVTVAFGNVHKGELDQLAPAIAALRRLRPELRIVIVPRYPGKIEPDLPARYFGPALDVVTEETAIPASGKLVWLNQMGTLAEVYSRSVIGVVCGTFGDVGGHDLAEPLHLGAASVYGPRIERQTALHRTLADLGCAVQVDSAEALVEVIDRLLGAGPERHEMIARFALLSQLAAERLAAIADELARLAVAHAEAAGAEIQAPPRR